MAGELVNRVAESTLVTLDLEEFYPAEEKASFDVKDFLFMGLILKEKDLFGADGDAVREENPNEVQLPFGPDAWWIRSPNNVSAGDLFASASRHHGDFDDDDATVKGTLARILGQKKTPSGDASKLDFRPTQSGMRACREKLTKAIERR